MDLVKIVLIAIVISVSVSPVEAGSIHGQVTFSGAQPKSSRIKVTKDQDYCGETIPEEIYIVGSNGGLKNAVVFLEKAAATVSTSAKEHTLENSGCRFAPRIMAMRKGEKLIAKNSDPKLHIVHSYLEKRTVFNVSLPFRGQILDVTRRIDKTGILQVNCDTHAWMRAYIHVFDHPYFAVSDERGAFAIPDAPPGKYTLNVWHEGAGVQAREVTVSDKGDLKIDFGFK
jgi:hypothetical protein